MRRIAIMIVAALVVSLGVSATATATEGWGSGQTAGTPTMDDLIPSMSSGQAYSERYSFSFNPDQGGHIGINLTISNLGVRSGYGASELRLDMPDRDRYSKSERESRRNWSYDEESFGLQIADAELRADGENAFEYRYDDGDVKVELRFEKRVPMWQPGNGEIRSGDDYYRFTLVAPRSRVTGRVYIDGEWHDVSTEDSGYADHVVTNVAPFDLGKRFTRFRAYEDDVFILWREIDLTSKYGGRPVTWVVVGVGDEIVYEDANAEVRFGEVERHESSGYQVPHAAQVRSDKGDDQLRFLLRGDDYNHRDLLASYGRVARMVAGSLSDPHQFNVEGRYALEVTVDGRPLRVTGENRFTIDYVNQ